MASFIEVEKLALALTEEERATLVAKLIESLPHRNSAHDYATGIVRYKTVNSSMLRKVRYDPEKQLLDVVFRTTGETYRYKDVPRDEYERLMRAKSHGTYMQTHIIDVWDVEKLED
jgi:hypothetical protein